MPGLEQTIIPDISTNQYLGGYVFDENYKLWALSKIEAYIAEDNHLPEIPSVCEVIDGGLDVWEMQVKIMQKTEELTLYLIEQHKQLQEFKKQNLELQSKILK